MKKTLCILPLALAIGAAMTQAEQQQGFELTAGWNKTNWDKDRDVKDSTGWLGGLGYRINDRWGVEALYIENNARIKNTNMDVDGTQLHLDALYHFNTDSRVQPFFLIGGGKNNFEIANIKTDESTFNVGAGVKAYLNDYFLLRADMRSIRGTKSGDIDMGLNVALTYFFGERDSKPMAKVAAVVPASDADNDGVFDTQDACPQTPSGVQVDGKGCPLDTDKDGVPDYKDSCPATEMGLKVDAKGCAIALTEAVAINLQVKFDNNADVVKPAFYEEIGAVAEFMKSYKDSTVEVQGYTDSRGSEAYNQGLSQRRADAVRAILIDKFGVAAARVTAVGYGEANPIADNESAQGREANRRVVASVQSEKTSKVRK